MKARLLALIAILFWSTAATAFKLSLRYMTPYELVTLASIVSLAALSVMGLVSGDLRPGRINEGNGLRSGSRGSKWTPALRGVLNPFLYYLVLLEAYDRLPAQIAMVINYLWPIVLVLLAVPVLKQKAGLWTISAAVVGFAGVVVLALAGASLPGGASLPAMGLALLSTVIWSAFWLMNLRSSDGPVIALQKSFAFGVLYLLALGAVTGRLGGLSGLPWQAYVGAVYVGLFEMGLAFVLWLRALSIARNTADVGNLVYLAPFISLVFIGTVTGESVGLWTIAGLLLVTSGIVLQKWKGSPAPEPCGAHPSADEKGK